MARLFICLGLSLCIHLAGAFWAGRHFSPKLHPQWIARSYGLQAAIKKRPADKANGLPSSRSFTPDETVTASTVSNRAVPGEPDSRKLGMQYYAPKEVNTPTHVISAIDFSDVLAPNDEGTLILRILVNEQGNVDDVLVESNSLSEAIADEAVKRFKAASYQPAQIGKYAVKSWVRLDISVMPEDSPEVP